MPGRRSQLWFLLLALAVVAVFAIPLTLDRVANRRAPRPVQGVESNPPSMVPPSSAASQDEGDEKGLPPAASSAEPGAVAAASEGEDAAARPARTAEAIQKTTSGPAPSMPEAARDENARVPEREERASRPPSGGAEGAETFPPGEAPAAPRTPAPGSTFVAMPPAGGAPAGSLTPLTPSDPTAAPSVATALPPFSYEVPNLPPSWRPPRPAPAPPTAQPPAVTAATVRMLADSAEISVGSMVSLRVLIESATDVGSVPFHVRFNPAVLRFEQGVEGPFLQGGGKQTAFFAAPTSDQSTVVVGLSRLGRGDGISGGGELCTLTFSAVGPGSAGLAFASAKVRDSKNRITPASFVPAQVVVH